MAHGTSAQQKWKFLYEINHYLIALPYGGYTYVTIDNISLTSPEQWTSDIVKQAVEKGKPISVRVVPVVTSNFKIFNGQNIFDLKHHLFSHFPESRGILYAMNRGWRDGTLQACCDPTLILTETGGSSITTFIIRDLREEIGVISPSGPFCHQTKESTIPSIRRHTELNLPGTSAASVNQSSCFTQGPDIREPYYDSLEHWVQNEDIRQSPLKEKYTILSQILEFLSSYQPNFRVDILARGKVYHGPITRIKLRHLFRTRKTWVMKISPSVPGKPGLNGLRLFIRAIPKTYRTQLGRLFIYNEALGNKPLACPDPSQMVTGDARVHPSYLYIRDMNLDQASCHKILTPGKNFGNPCSIKSSKANLLCDLLTSNHHSIQPSQDRLKLQRQGKSAIEGVSTGDIIEEKTTAQSNQKRPSESDREKSKKRKVIFYGSSTLQQRKVELEVKPSVRIKDERRPASPVHDNPEIESMLALHNMKEEETALALSSNNKETLIESGLKEEHPFNIELLQTTPLKIERGRESHTYIESENETPASHKANRVVSCSFSVQNRKERETDNEEFKKSKIILRSIHQREVEFLKSHSPVRIKDERQFSAIHEEPEIESMSPLQLKEEEIPITLSFSKENYVEHCFEEEPPLKVEILGIVPLKLESDKESHMNITSENQTPTSETEPHSEENKKQKVTLNRNNIPQSKEVKIEVDSSVKVKLEPLYRTEEEEAIPFIFSSSKKTHMQETSAKTVFRRKEMEDMNVNAPCLQVNTLTKKEPCRSSWLLTQEMRQVETDREELVKRLTEEDQSFNGNVLTTGNLSFVESLSDLLHVDKALGILDDPKQIEQLHESAVSLAEEGQDPNLLLEKEETAYTFFIFNNALKQKSFTADQKTLVLNCKIILEELLKVTIPIQHVNVSLLAKLTMHKNMPETVDIIRRLFAEIGISYSNQYETELNMAVVDEKMKMISP